MLNSLFHKVMRRLIKTGTLHVIDHEGQRHSYIGNPQEPAITIRFHAPHIMKRIVVNPDLALGEGYMDGQITVENGSIYDLLLMLGSNLNAKSFPVTQKLYWHTQQLIQGLGQVISPAATSKSNVAHHYDLSPELYELFLDQDKQYSCAYFQNIGNDLNTAQLHKKRHLAAKLRLQPGQRVLDIGCGWGGLALYLAKIADVQVVGLTLSEEQYKIATQRAHDLGLADRVKFLVKDYREINEKFDRIVSVGMFEHVGKAQFKIFFKQLYNFLADDGVALLHSIGSENHKPMVSPWFFKYIFPGGFIPTLADVFPVILKQGFHVTDIEILHHHYANTLQAWRQRFLANRHMLPKHLDDRFVRMWEYYLSGSQVGFQKLGLMNFQLQLMKNKQFIPLTRDYIYEQNKPTF